ncbi:MAG: threonine--tRNA ligase [Verrucomicrobia bacterium 13_1_20CM_54_28]|jgi:threonyl-tRNA synthetase|nr:MAG: threonine--tRNA ligase [Verrucomicrobia bacterium 13_2_20CM_2_54_15]OLD74043.1 MAG: threonine--tRNA ligase [Verrucomicrobia bacterium 13_1_20CM_54_28]
MQEERKTLDERQKMTDLQRLRHSASHVLATAILKIWPEAQFAAGPPVENGFYYDVDLPHRISPDDFEKIEAEMKKEIKANHPFERIEVSRDEALELGKKGRLAALSERPEPSEFKVDIIENIPPDEKISLYRSGDFIDLCAGPHVMRTGNIGAFKLTNVASAYYKGDEKNPQLQRVYGTAFKTKKELDDYFEMLEEAKKRDHRKLGKELELFVFDDDVGPGLPMFLPRGAVIAEELEKLAKETEFAAGYQRVRTPHIARESLYRKSGHVPYYLESMFPPMTLVEDKDKKQVEKANAMIAYFENYGGDAWQRVLEDAESGNLSDPAKKQDLLIQLELVRSAERADETKLRELKQFAASIGDRYYLKAMNCPHHHKLFAALPRSYRDLPLRLAEYGTDYRYEKSGELFGLMRVRSLQMNDAHLYMTPEQFEAEFNAVNEMYLNYFKLFGIDKYLMRFSTHDPDKLGQKFVDEPELWKKTEEMTRKVLENSGINYVEVPNEAAFYGPKIDVQAWSVIGREFSIATNQVDFAQPRSFDLRYKDRDNTDKTPICIHRAPLGTHERFIGFLIEHYAGNFPLWLSPEQVRILTIGDDPKLLDYARSILKELRAHQVRAEIDDSSDKINGKIQRAEQMKVHTMFVIGKRDLEADAVSVRVHGKGNLGAKPRSEAIAEILLSIKERRA